MNKEIHLTDCAVENSIKLKNNQFIHLFTLKNILLHLVLLLNWHLFTYAIRCVVVNFCCPGLNFREVPKTNLGMEFKNKIIASLVGSLVCMGLFFLMLWFVIPRPNDIDVPVVVEDGDAVVNTIGNAYTLIDLHSVSALWSGSTMVLVFVMLLVTGCCCKKKALKTVHSHMSMKLKDEFTALLETYKRHDSSKHDRVQESAASRQEQLERRTQRERTRLDMEALDEEEARMEVAQRRAQLAKRRNQEDYNQQHGGYSDREGVAYVRRPEGGAGGGVLYNRGATPYRGDAYGDYQVVPVEHQAMVHQPSGVRGRGRGGVTSSRYGVDISHLSEEGQRIYSAVH